MLKILNEYLRNWAINKTAERGLRMGKVSKMKPPYAQKYELVPYHEIICPICGKKFWGNGQRKYDTVLCAEAARKKRIREKKAAQRQALKNEQV